MKAERGTLTCSQTRPTRLTRTAAPAVPSSALTARPQRTPSSAMARSTDTHASARSVHHPLALKPLAQLPEKSVQSPLQLLRIRRCSPATYRRRPRRPLFRRVESVGIGVVSSARHRGDAAHRRARREQTGLAVRYGSESRAASRRGRARVARTNAADLEASTRERAESRLRARAGRLGPVATGRAHLDVQRGDAQLLALLRHILGGKHGSVRRRLIAVSLHLHATRHLDDRLLAGAIRHVHERVVERRVDVRSRKDVLALLGLHAQRDRGRLLHLSLVLLGRLLNAVRGGARVSPSASAASPGRPQRGREPSVAEAAITILLGGHGASRTFKSCCLKIQQIQHGGQELR
jgi:hypothetical protein